MFADNLVLLFFFCLRGALNFCVLVSLKRRLRARRSLGAALGCIGGIKEIFRFYVFGEFRFKSKSVKIGLLV